MLHPPLMFSFFFFFILCFSSCVIASVSYDHKAIIVNGQRKILISGSIHYPRSTPEMWPDLIQKAKDGGLDVIQTYVFWNGHEPSPGQYYFEGRYDLVRFIKLVKQAGLYIHLRVGPYVCAEWNFGGFPVWLKYIPNISFRTDNEPFKAAMKEFTTKIINMMKAERLFETQGGPIILSQIENELDPIEYELGAPIHVYAEWAANMAVGLDTGVPWVMCKQQDAPDPIINTCNDFYCDWFSPNKDNKPKMWTENWSGWFTAFGQPVPHRPVEDLAFSVAQFVQKGGSFINYYMYHGGTNFGRTAGSFIATTYDYDAPIDEYGLLRQPKWGHLKDLHKVIKLCEPALVYSEPNVTKLGNNQEAHVFMYEAGGCAAFLANYDPQNLATVAFGAMNYNLPPWSISILPDCKNVFFNTARVSSQSSQMQMTSVGENFSWMSYTEETPSNDESSITMVGLMEQINITRDVSDYLWYSTDVNIDPDEAFLKNGQKPWLTVISAGHAVNVFINGQFSGTAYGGLQDPRLTFSANVNLTAGINRLSLLSVAVGLPNVGVHFETWNAGVLGPVTLEGLNEGKRNLSGQKWSYKIGLNGEAMSVYSLQESSTVKWVDGSSVAQWKPPLTWYKTTFDEPPGDDPLALDMSTMGKGQAWINGQSIGRHWPAYKAEGNCGDCNYTGRYNDKKKCQTNCGEASQRWYHVPRSWLKPTDNLLVVFEEWGGHPNGISLVRRTTKSVCAEIYERQPPMTYYLEQSIAEVDRVSIAKAHLQCPPGQKISSIKFASFGTPKGVCGSFSEGSCHASASNYVFEMTCIGQQACSVSVSSEVFGGDPCPGVMKKLSVEAICSSWLAKF